MALRFKSIYHISKMDCPSEEQLIRMKLSEYDSIEHLDFDIANRKLSVIHNGISTDILNLLEELKLDTELIAESETNESSSKLNDSSNERKILWAVLF